MKPLLIGLALVTTGVLVTFLLAVWSAPADPWDEDDGY